MINNPELVVFLLMLPVVIQIIIPLLMLVVFGLVCAVRFVFGWKRREGNDAKIPRENAIEQTLLHPWQTVS